MATDAVTRRAFTSLVAAACVDGRATAPEIAYLSKKAAEFGIGAAEAQALIEEGVQGNFTVSVPPTPAGRAALLDELLDVICADGRVESQERALLLRFGTHLGAEPAELGTRLRDRLNQRRSEGARPTRPPRPSAPPPPPPPPHPSASSSPLSMSPSAPPTATGPMRAPAREASARPSLDSPVPVRLSPGEGMGLDAGQGPNLLSLAPGPIKLHDTPTAGPDDLTPITKELVKNVIRFDGRDEAVAYVERTCQFDKARAKAAVDRLLAEDPQLVPGGQRLRHGR